MTIPDRLTFYERKEIADSLWRLFMMISRCVTFAFDKEGLTIRIPFTKEVDLDGPAIVYGLIRGQFEYYEHYIEFEEVDEDGNKTS